MKVVINACFGGYLLSAAGVARFERLYADGWDGNSFTRELIEPLA